MDLHRIRSRPTALGVVMALALVGSLLAAASASAAPPKSPKPAKSACALVPAKDVRAVFHAPSSLKVLYSGFADAPTTTGGTKVGWSYYCAASALPNPNMSGEEDTVTWFPGATRSVYSTVAGPGYGLNTDHDPLRPLSGVGQAAEYFGNNVVVFTKASVVAITVTPSGAIGAKAAAVPVATLKKAASAAVHHLP